MGYQVFRKVADVVETMGFKPNIEKTGYGHQLSFVSHQDSGGRDVKVTLGYVKGVFERVPATKNDVGRNIYVWQLQFVYPFKIDLSRHTEALRLVNSINPRLAMPGFHLIEEDSAIGFGYCLMEYIIDLDPNMFVDLIGCALNQYDHFLPEFEALCQPSWK